MQFLETVGISVCHRVELPGPRMVQPGGAIGPDVREDLGSEYRNVKRYCPCVEPRLRGRRSPTQGPERGIMLIRVIPRLDGA